jgi:hypothetical protein
LKKKEEDEQNEKNEKMKKNGKKILHLFFPGRKTFLKKV